MSSVEKSLYVCDRYPDMIEKMIEEIMIYSYSFESMISDFFK